MAGPAGPSAGGMELALTGYFLVGALVALHRGLWTALPCLVLCVVGCGYVSWRSLSEQGLFVQLATLWARVQTAPATSRS